jgi:hypothetical protein
MATSRFIGSTQPDVLFMRNEEYLQGEQRSHTRQAQSPVGSKRQGLQLGIEGCTGGSELTIFGIIVYATQSVCYR